MGRDELLVVELGDFFLWIELKVVKIVPLDAVDLLEEVPLFLSDLWRWLFRSLAHVEREGEELLPVRGLEGLLLAAEVVNRLLVDREGFLELLDSCLKRSWASWLWSVVSCVYESLDGHWVSSGFLQLL